MDRAIKFRAWDTERKQFVSEGEIVFSNYGDTHIKVYPNSQDYIGDICHDYYKPSRFIVIQFTGLYDCEEKEIWEDDVVEYTQHHFNTDMTKVKRKVVKWNYDRWNIHETSAGESNIKVLGNIYEHPNLLENG